MPITAGDPPSPLPSEVLASVDEGRGVAGFLIRPADLDRMALLVHGGPEHDGCEEQADALRAEVARLSVLAARAGIDPETYDRLRRQLDEANRNTAEAREDADRYATAITTLEQERNAARAEVVSLGQQLDACRAQQGRQVDTILELRTRQPDPVEDDPRRPHPDDWPDDAVLLRYRELRDLVALHLDRYADTRTARAMRDGDVPLRLAEVLRP